MNSLKLTKTSKIVSAVVVVVLSGSLGYLIWRMNNTSNLGPQDSDAAQCPEGYNYFSMNEDTSGQKYCVDNQWQDTMPANCYKSTSTGCMGGYGWISASPTTTEPGVSNCGTEPNYSFNKAPTTGIGPFPEDGKVVLFYKSFLGSDYKPKLTFKDKNGQLYTYTIPALDSSNRARIVTDIKVSSGDTIELVQSNDNNNQGTPPCNPGDQKYISWGWIAPVGGSCGSGLQGPPTNGTTTPMEKISASSDIAWAQSFGNPIVSKGSQCWADWREWPGDYDFNDYFLQISYEVTNTCQNAAWDPTPPTKIKYEGDVDFNISAADPDGVEASSVVVKKDNTVIPLCTDSTAKNCYNISGSGENSKIGGVIAKVTDTGSHTLSVSWNDAKSTSSATCTLYTTYEVLTKETNPDWDISKAVVEQCIDENTTNPKSELTYTITVTNTGDGAGQISRIEDVLDTKVEDTFVKTDTITGGGTYSSGKIVWDFSAAPVAVDANGGTKTYTYKLEIDKDHFDTYANEVTLTPVGSDAIKATANITADCQIADEPEVPQTGIFDTTMGRILAGASLVIIGAFVYLAPNISLNVHIRNGKMYIRDKNISKLRKRFEKKVENS